MTRGKHSSPAHVSDRTIYQGFVFMGIPQDLVVCPFPDDFHDSAGGDASDYRIEILHPVWRFGIL